MGDLKLFAINIEELVGLFTRSAITLDVFWLDKCAKATFGRCLFKQTTSTKLDTDTNINELDPRKSYIYLEININGTQHVAMKEEIRKEY